MRAEKNRHKRKFSRKKINYSYSRNSDQRFVPLNVRLLILFGGVLQFVGIVFTITGLISVIPVIITGNDIRFIWLALIFPVIGILLLFFSIKKRKKYIQIIKTGKVSYGTYVRNERTNITINNQAVYRYFFDFKDENGEIYTTFGETHTNRLTDEEQELLVYNTENPSEAVIIDALPIVVKNYLIKIFEAEKKDNVISEY